MVNEEIPEAKRLHRRVVDSLRRRELPLSRRAQFILTTVLFIALIAFTVWSINTLPSTEGELRWWPLVIATFILVPLGMAFNAWEYQLTGELVGVSIGKMSAMRIGVVSSAANLLPIPGAAITRMEALRRGGTPGRVAARATIIVGLVYLLIACFISAVLLIPLNASLSIPFFISSFALVFICIWLLRHTALTVTFRTLLCVIIVEIATVVLFGLRLLLIFQALNMSVSAATAIVVGASAPLSSAIGFFPGGLGVREGISAALATGAGLSAQAGFLASSIDRVCALIGLAIVAIPVYSQHAGSIRRQTT